MSSRSKKRRARRARQQARAELGVEQLEGIEQPAPCPICKRIRSTPALGEVAIHRYLLWAAGLGTRGDLLVYAYACSGIMLTDANQAFMCECDRTAWHGAIESYKSQLPSSCWAAIGVTDELMVWAREEVARRGVWDVPESVERAPWESVAQRCASHALEKNPHQGA